MQKLKEYAINIPNSSKLESKVPVRVPIGSKTKSAEIKPSKEKKNAIPTIVAPVISVKGGGQKKEKVFKGKTKFDGLWESDLNKIAKSVPNYLGTFARDELKEVHPPKKESWGLIMNMSTRNDPSGGTHWVSIMNNANDKYCAYYDSLMDSKGHQKGENPPKDVMEQIKRMIKESDLDYIPKFKWNVAPDQYCNTQTCGFHAASVLIDTLNRGKSWADATGFNSIKGGENHIKQLANRFGFIL